MSSLPVKKAFKRITLLYAVTLPIVSYLWFPYFTSMIVMAPLILMGVEDLIQKKSSLRRNFPVLARLRYIMENYMREEIRQYFIVDDTVDDPISREFRSVVYQRSKSVKDTMPFGTQRDVYRVGYEWMNHSLYASNKITDPRVMIGGAYCKQPYSASIMNISAMSFGSMSKNAILAMNKGAKLGGFSHNTGEGSVSPYHLENGGDIVAQIGTGYFGWRDENGNFCRKTFEKKSKDSRIKMIEIKLSQGAKPGKGGVLPASKNTVEIAEIRGLEPHTNVYSPASHSEFSDPKGLLEFVKELRMLSGGKPVGFKLCVGDRQEFIDIVEAMIELDIKPDFITVDGAAGGTGAAPREFSNSVGTPLKEGLPFVENTLIKYGVRKDIKIIASEKILTGFHIARALALGADAVNVARGFMLSIGCIAAKTCDGSHGPCPVGIASAETQDGLDVEDKSIRAYNFHKNTIAAFCELLSATGLPSPGDLQRKHIMRRVSATEIKSYEEIYPYETV